jgi:hypothetical protein
MTGKGKTIIFNSLIWAFVIVASAVILKGTPYKARVISVITLGSAASLGLITGIGGKKK